MLQTTAEWADWTASWLAKMRSSQPTLLLFAALLVTTTLLGCSPKPPGGGNGGGAPAQPVWTEDTSLGTVGSLSGVWGTAADNVYVVGGSEKGAEIYHYDGQSWTAMEVPALAPEPP